MFGAGVGQRGRPYANTATLRARLRRYAAFLLLAAMLVLSLAVGLLTPADALGALMREGGPVETLTATLFLAAMAMVWVAGRRTLAPFPKACVTLILFACYAREVSMRHWLIAERNGACCSEAFAWSVAGAVIALAVAGALWLAARYARAFAAALRHRRPVVMTFAAMAAAVVLSQTLDRFAKIAKTAGYVAGERVLLATLSLEEMLELLLPVLVVLAVHQVTGRTKPVP